MHSIKKSLALTLCAASLVGLTACGGGDDNNSSSSKSVTVTPSLGKMENATVSLFEADGVTLLGTSELKDDGTATITFNNYTGPIVAQVKTIDGAKYVDEVKKELVSLEAGKMLHAIASAADTHIAVTALTNAAYFGAMQQNLFPLDQSEVDAMNEKVRSALAQSLDSILTPPTLFDLDTVAGDLENDDAGEYALILASLAKLGEGQDAPAWSVSEALYNDLADFKIDGKNGLTELTVPYDVNNFVNQYNTALTSMATNYANATLQTAISSFATPKLDIDFTYTPTTNTNGNTDVNGAGGNYTLIVKTEINGASTTTTVNNIAKPESQEEFCDDAEIKSMYEGNAYANAQLTVNQCTFNGNVGVIDMTMAISSPVSMTIPYKVTYTFQ